MTSLMGGIDSDARRQSLDWIGLCLSVVSNRYAYPLYAEIERDHGLLRDEAAVVVCLSLKSGATAQEIVANTGRPKNSISRAVRKLEAGRFVRREGDADDGRASKLYLTSRGNTLFKRIEGYYADRDKRMLSTLSDKEKREFSRTLEKIANASPDWM